jgi:hypothetical protein
MKLPNIPLYMTYGDEPNNFYSNVSEHALTTAHWGSNCTQEMKQQRSEENYLTRLIKTCYLHLTFPFIFEDVW